jgi:NAD-dependent DNA ligase
MCLFVVSVNCVRRAAVKAWGARLAKSGVLDPESVDWVVEPKVDGLAVRIMYR